METILVGYLEELEVEAPAVKGIFRILLRHRDQAGKLYTVQVDARRVVSHNIEAKKGRDLERTVFRFPRMELAAFMDGDVLRVCRRDDAARFLQSDATASDDRGQGDQLV